MSINVEKDVKTRKQLNKHKHQDLIIGISHLEEVERIVANDESIKKARSEIKNQINELIQEVHLKLKKDVHKVFYNQVKAMTLSEKNLIRNGNPKWLISKRMETDQ